MSPTELTCGFLAECSRRFETATRRTEHLLAELPKGAEHRRISSAGWSVCQCLDHLALAAELYLPGIVAAIDDGRKREIFGTAPYGRGTLVGRMLVGAVDPTATKRRRYKAPGLFAPPAEQRDRDEVGDRVRKINRQFLELIGKADGLDLGKLKMATPISRLVRVTVAQAFEIQSLHEIRHVQQAETIAERLSSTPVEP